MRRYETIFILRPDQGEPQIKDTIKRFSTIVSQGGGEVVENEEWGSRELAYRIKGERRGYYIRLDYLSDGAVMNEVERNLKLSDTVLRYLSVLVDDNADAVKVREEIETRNQRIAEARAAAEARASAYAARRPNASASRKRQTRQRKSWPRRRIPPRSTPMAVANRIELTGRVTRTPELRVTPAGTPVLNFSIECAEPRKAQPRSGDDGGCGSRDRRGA